MLRLLFLYIQVATTSSPGDAVCLATTRHELRPCFVRPIAAGINELALLTLTIPACRAPRGVTLPHFA